MDGFAPGAIWPAPDVEDRQVREIFSRYGLAMHMAQVLEHAMVNAVMVISHLPTMRDHPDRASWEASFDGRYAAELAQTYGNMLKTLARLDGFPANLLDLLRAAKENRDVLAHRFFRQNDLAFMNPDGRKATIAWCEQSVNCSTH